MSYSIEILRAADKFLDKLSKQQPSDADAIEVAIDGFRALRLFSWRVARFEGVVPFGMPFVPVQYPIGDQ